jgi:hypothetical protein
VISRRRFVAGACCLFPTTTTLARQPPLGFLCATPDVEGHPASSIPRHPPEPFPMVGATLDPSQLWRQGDGATPKTGLITLSVCFLNGTRTDHDLVRRIAPEWIKGRLGHRLAFRFGAAAEASHIRIKFRGGGASLSEVGRDNLIKPKEQRTMNLSVVDQRDILHEFGHALGLKHEHQHPNSGIRWNKPVVLRDLKRQAHWSSAMVEENIFKHFSKNCTCIGDKKPDPLSVMLYPIQPSWTLDRRGTGYNTTISARDRGCLEREYKA